jgi:MFS superfamily sulfate permease-like transporter
VAFLGRIPGTRRFSDRERHPDNDLLPGILIFRPESSLIYFNVDHVRDTISQRVLAERAKPLYVILDLSAAPTVDLQSAHTLAELADELRDHGVCVQAVEARSSVRERLRAEGLSERLGTIDRFRSVADVVDNIQQVTAKEKPGPGASNLSSA